jgi:hypothetical protein
MDKSFSSAVDQALEHRERLLEHLLQAKVLEDEGQVVQIQYLVDLIDGLLALILKMIGSH